MPIELNELETKRFGIVAAKVIDATANPEAIAAAAHAKGVQMLTVRVDVGDLPRVHALEAAGYQLMDTLVYYSRSLDELPPTRPLTEGVTLRRARPEDATALGEIAAAAFADYMGHYHTDPRLDSAAADAAYVEWAMTSAASASDASPVMLAECGGQVTGFLTLRRSSPHEFEIVLNAIHPDSQGCGLYAALVASSLTISWKAGVARVITSTQINNYAAQRVWSRLGFFHYRSSYTFHKWFEQPRLQTAASVACQQKWSKIEVP